MIFLFSSKIVSRYRRFLLFQIFIKLFGAQGSPSSGQLTESVSPRFLITVVVIMVYLFVFDDSLTSKRLINASKRFINVMNHCRRGG